MSRLHCSDTACRLVSYTRFWLFLQLVSPTLLPFMVLHNTASTPHLLGALGDTAHQHEQDGLLDVVHHARGGPKDARRQASGQLLIDAWRGRHLQHLLQTGLASSAAATCLQGTLLPCGCTSSEACPATLHHALSHRIRLLQVQSISQPLPRLCLRAIHAPAEDTRHCTWLHLCAGKPILLKGAYLALAVSH